MNYTFDRTAVLVRQAHERDDDEQWATVTQPAALGALDFTDTQPATMDADQLRRDLIASQCQAPRIPRKRSPILSADSPDGTSRQGRDIPAPTEPISRISDEQIERLLMWLTATAAVMGAAACAYWTAVA